MRIIYGMMNSNEIEVLIQEHDERAREQRNRMLRARLARPCSQEELLLRLAQIPECVTRQGKGQIPLTNSSTQYIMESAR